MAKVVSRSSGPVLVRVTSTVIDGVTVERDQKLVVDGEEGVFRFDHVRSDGSVTCWGGVSGHESWRTFHFERCHLPGWVAPIDVAPVSGSRASKYQQFELWALGHPLEQFSTQQLAEISGFSNATMVKYLETSLFFEKVKRGVWQVKDLSDSRLGVL